MAFLLPLLIIVPAAFVVAFFIYKVIEEITSVGFCYCSHEYNEHIVYPRGMVNPAGSEKCKLCSCKNYKQKSESNLYMRWNKK